MEICHSNQKVAFTNATKLNVGSVNEILTNIEIFLHRYRTRKQLRELSSEQLSDMGISVEQLAEETKKPFWR